MRPRVLTHDIKGDGEPLILVPGGLTGWLAWIPHQERLSDRHQVIRVQPIHNELGSAGKPGDPSYTREVERESLRITLDELANDRADFAGWSNGGRALIEFTLAYPERVRSLTLVEPAAHWILTKLGESDPRLDEFIRYMYGLAGKEVTEDDLALFLSVAGFVDDPTRAREDPYWERALPHRMALSWLSEDLLGSDHSPNELASITCPVLLTKGTVTEAWQKRVVDLIGKLVPDAPVVELEGSHAHHIENLDDFLAEFEAHLTRARAS
ncbi:MAG: alpha/beta fold hydrolase [Acidimicrobiia bacterium]